MRWIVLPAVVVAFVLAVAGCGGSSSDDASSSDEVTAVETSDDSTATETSESDSTSTETTEDTTASDDTTEDTAGVDLSGSGLSDECQQLVAASAKYSQAFSSVTAGGELNLDDASEALQAVADAAPSEIKGAYETLAAAIGKYAEALQGVDLSGGGTPDPATLQKIAEAAQSFDNAEVTQATQEISAWTTENCSASAP